jgi:hypothetical protein
MFCIYQEDEPDDVSAYLPCFGLDSWMHGLLNVKLCYIYIYIVCVCVCVCGDVQG